MWSKKGGGCLLLQHNNNPVSHSFNEDDSLVIIIFLLQLIQNEMNQSKVYAYEKGVVSPQSIGGMRDDT